MEKFENQKEQRDRITEGREFFAPLGYQFFHGFLEETYGENNGLVSYRQLETKFNEYLDLYGKEVKHIVGSDEEFENLSDEEIKKFIIYASIDEAVKRGKASGLNPAGQFKDKPIRQAIRDLNDYLGILSNGFPNAADIEKEIWSYKEHKKNTETLLNDPRFSHKKDVNLAKIEELNERIAAMSNNLKKE